MENLRYILSLWRFWVALAIVGSAAIVFHVFAPPQHNPLRPLELTDPIGLATYGKLTDTKYDADMCFAALDRAGLQYTPLQDEETGSDCGFKDALMLAQTRTRYSAPVRLTCPMAATLYIWEAHIARPQAEKLLGSEITRIETYGSYSCRNIAGTRRRSEHARANAIDIAGFRLADGRLITVKEHWDERSKEGRFLRRVHDGACDLFSVTLGPDFNAAHADHFHFDFGSGRSCR